MLDFSNKFKIEENTIYKSKYWTWSLRPEQVTLGSSILSLNRKCRNFSELDKEEFADLESIVKLIEKTLKSTFSYDKINYLMLMMVDDHVHFHVLPRYEEIRDLYGLKWIDQDWPRPSRLESFINDDEILSKIVSDLKSNIAKKSDFVVGYATGVFDMFHIGHLNLLKRAKENCDYLIVGVTTDELVAYKNQQAIIPLDERIEIVRNCIYVDEVVVQDNMDKIVAWEKYKYDRLFVGSDWQGTEKWNHIESELNKRGSEVVYFPYTQGRSSTQLRKTLGSK